MCEAASFFYMDPARQPDADASDVQLMLLVHHRSLAHGCEIRLLKYDLANGSMEIHKTARAILSHETHEGGSRSSSSLKTICRFGPGRRLQLLQQRPSEKGSQMALPVKWILQ